jgi:hypothetical protein
MSVILGADGRPMQRSRIQPGVRSGRNILDVHQLMGWLQRPDNIGLETYERMVQTDETIAAGLEFVTLAPSAAWANTSTRTARTSRSSSAKTSRRCRAACPRPWATCWPPCGPASQ